MYVCMYLHDNGVLPSVQTFALSVARLNDKLVSNMLPLDSHVQFLFRLLSFRWSRSLCGPRRRGLLNGGIRTSERANGPQPPKMAAKFTHPSLGGRLKWSGKFDRFSEWSHQKETPLVFDGSSRDRVQRAQWIAVAPISALFWHYGVWSINCLGYITSFSTFYFRAEPGSEPVESFIQMSGTFMPFGLRPSLELRLWGQPVWIKTKEIQYQMVTVNELFDCKAELIKAEKQFYELT